MTTFTSYDAVGIKEDISDIITNISPRKTPFQNGIGNEKVTQKFFQWQEDSLRAVATNAQVEGFDAQFITVTPTVMRTNNTQILSEASQVSGTMDATTTYGRARESAYQMAKSAAQVKRDLENALVGTAQSAVVGGDGAARQMAGYQQQVSQTGAGAPGTATGPIIYMGVGNFLTEAALLDCLQNLYQAGAEPNTVSVSPANSLVVAAFAKASGRFREIRDAQPGSTKMVNAVDLYVSPFGEVKVIINRFQRGGTVAPTTGNTLVYEASMWAKATLRPWFREVLAKTGDSVKQMIVGEFSVKHKNFLASGIIVDNLASGF